MSIVLDDALYFGCSYIEKGPYMLPFPSSRAKYTKVSVLPNINIKRCGVLAVHQPFYISILYLYTLSRCIGTQCGTGSKHNACAMDMIRDELRSNNIEIDRETLSFHIDACLREHEDIYGAFINQLDKDNLPTNLPNSLCDIYEEMCPNNFGRLIAYLTLVYQAADSCEEEIIREVAQRTVEDFKYIDLEKYKVKRSIPFKALLNQLLIRTVFAYFA